MDFPPKTKEKTAIEAAVDNLDGSLGSWDEFNAALGDAAFEDDVDKALRRRMTEEEAQRRLNALKAQGAEQTLIRRSAASVAGRERLVDLVEGVLPARGRGEIFGPSTAGKTHVALGLACHLALGRDWFGRSVARTVDVVYLSNEGVLRERVCAWLSWLGVENIDRLHFYEPHIDGQGSGVDLTNEASVAGFLRALERDGVAHGPRAGTVVIIDTRANAAPGNENAPEHAQAVNAALSAISSWGDGLAMDVHHTGWENQDRQRGHSGGFAALDVSIRILDGSIKVTKLKTSGERWGARFEYREVVGCDGGPITVPATAAGSEGKTKSQKLLAAANAVWEWTMDAHEREQQFTSNELVSQMYESIPSLGRNQIRKTIQHFIEDGVFELVEGEVERPARGGEVRMAQVKWLVPNEFAYELWRENNV